MPAMDLVPLVETFRGGTLECVHFGALAVVDTRGRVLAQGGNPHWRTFTRSTLKPLQALPFVEGGGVRHFGLSTANLALLCASHSGEPRHVEQVDQILAKAGVDCRRLQCGCHVPIFVELGAWPPPAPGSYDERSHNCSGKHSGFLAHCVQHGLPLESYLDPAHPLQQAVRAAVAEAVGLDEAQLAMGIDGCSAPNYAMPLAQLARGFARLASGTRDARFGESFAALAQAMTAHPDLVSGTGTQRPGFHAGRARRLGDQGRCRRGAGGGEPQPRRGARAQDRRRQQVRAVRSDRRSAGPAGVARRGTAPGFAAVAQRNHHQRQGSAGGPTPGGVPPGAARLGPPAGHALGSCSAGMRISSVPGVQW
jgi:L-asparaginase II